MFSVSREFENEDRKVLMHILVEEGKVTITRHVDNKLADKMVYTPNEADELNNLLAIAMENVIR